MIFFVFPNGFADKNTVVPNFSLVNQPSLDKKLKVEVLIHSDNQLRTVYLILGYTPISTNFQASKCVIKAKDPRLHQISVVVPSFLTVDPILEDILKIVLPSQCTVKGRRQPYPSLQLRKRKGSLKFLTLKMTLKSSTNLYLLKPYLVTLATLFPHKQARPKETPLY